MILVTAAYGKAARRVVTELVKAGLPVRAMDMNPEVETLKEIGVAETYVGDIRNTEDIRAALDGCDQVMYIPPLFVYDEAKIAINFIDEAVKANVRQYVLLSVTHPNMSTLLQHTQKLKSEEHLVYQGLIHGLNYTILQPMHYCHNFDVAQVEATGVCNVFYSVDRKLSIVDASDVGQVAAKVLSEDGHQNATYELCGTEYLTTRELVDIYNEVSGKQAVANTIDIEDLIHHARIPDSYTCEGLRALSYTYDKYGIAGNPNVLTWLLGRKPTTFREFVEHELQK